MGLFESDNNNSPYKRNCLFRKHTIKTKKLKSLFSTPGLLLFFLMLFVPTSYQELKAILLALTILIILFSILTSKKTNLAPQTLIWVFIWVISGLVFMLIGSFNSNPGALRVGTVYVIWPLVYLMFIMGTSKLEMLNRIFKVLTFSSIAIGLYALSYILYSYGLLPSSLYINLDMKQSIGFYSGMMAYSMNNTSTLLFLVPFLMCALMTWPKDNSLNVNKFFIVSGLILGIILTFVSGRRVLQILVVFTPFLIIFYQYFFSRKDRIRVGKITRRMLVFLVGSVVIIYIFLNQNFDINISTIIEDIKTGFKSSTNFVGQVRSEQLGALLSGWSQSPFVGSGHGASAPGLIRSTEQPWAYELSYVAYLYHTGLIGFLIFIGQIVWIFIMSIKVIKSESILKYYMLPVIVGTTCFLIANATNPYLEKYDFLWVLFLPLSIINTWLISQNKNKEKKEDLYNEQFFRYYNS